MSLKNLPIEQPAVLRDLLTCRPGQVSSMSLAKDAAATCLLMAFSAGESISELTYFDDMAYYVIEGELHLALPNREVLLSAGSIIMVPAGTEHAVAASGPVKMLQFGL